MIEPYYLIDEALPEIKFISALVYLLKTLQPQGTISRKQTINQFMTYLSQNIQNVLKEAV